MARLPPAHGGPKFFLGKHSKGPSSTKTLTTNTHTTTTGVSSVIHDPSVPRTYLFDIYKNEAESHFEIGEYRQAADCYNAAIKLQPSDTAAIVARSRCYCQMGRWKRAMKDCDEALSIDAAFGEALYQKADILYVNGNLDLALVYFKRALRQSPDSIRYKNALQKVSEAIQRQGPAAAHKASKLTAVGDLSMFLHHKTRLKKPKDIARMDDDEKFELPSAGFRARFNVGPLIRINRKPGVSILRTYRSEATKSASSTDSAHRDPDEGTMRAILGELYGDRKYLKRFQNNLPGGKAERDLTLLADEGLDFLRERTIFWDSLGPLPPPQVPKRSNMRERSFYLTNPDPNHATTITGNNNNNNNTATTKMMRTPRGINPPPESLLYDDHLQATPRLPAVKESSFTMDKSSGDEKTMAPTMKRQRSNLAAPKKTPRRAKRLEEAMGLERDVSNVDFKFRSLQPSRSASRTDDLPDMDCLPMLRDTTRTKTRMGRTMFVGMDDPAKDRKRELTRFINKEMDNIDEAFKTGEYEDCKNKAEICLRTVASLPGDDINKSEVMASLHSCLGNACIALNDFDGALSHHLEALTIGETENLLEVINRSLGHLGRMYIIQKRFNKALEVFARKAPAVVSAEEVAQVFHEIGNCFLALGHLDYARDCGKKALRAALEADIHYFKFQSWVLIAVAESRLKHHDEAYKAFEQALELAQKKDDQESVTVILFAMEHLSKTITSIMRKRAMLSERLMSRSKTQTIIDLNKRPHAARAKKKKKRLRREDTSVDLNPAESAMTTRQNTTMLTKEVTWLDNNDDNEYEEEERNEKNKESGITEEEGEAGGRGGGEGGLTSPSQEYKRPSTVMFEKSPRELEPFGDPDFRKQKQKEKEKQMAAAISRQNTQSRHGMLEAIGGSGSRRGSWDQRQDAGLRSGGSRHHHETPTRLEIPASPRNFVDAGGGGGGGGGSGGGGSGRRKNINKGREAGGDMHAKDTHLSPLRQLHDDDGSATPLETARDEGGGVRHYDDDSTVHEDGFLSQREEYFHPSKGGMHSHRGGFHSNRESRTDHHNDPAAGGGASDNLNNNNVIVGGKGAGSETDSAVHHHHHRGGGAKSKMNASMNMGSLRETPLLEEGGKGEGGGENDRDNPGDVTGVSSGPLPLNSRGAGGHLTPRLNDLSVTMESSFREVDLDMTETPRDAASCDVTPRYKNSSDLHDTSTSTRSKRTTTTANNPRKTPGRFTRESYYEDNPDITVGNMDDPSATFEHISVSRAQNHHRHHHQQQRKQIPTNTATEEGTRRRRNGGDDNHNPEEHSRNVIAETDDYEEEQKLSARQQGGGMALERQSSKVAMRGKNKSKEDTMVTLETSKPYRVSSAASVRSGRSNRKDGEGEEEEEEGDAVQETKRQASKGGNNNHIGRKVRKAAEEEGVASPDRSQASGFTTGSGWEGDVSTEDATKLGVKKDKEAMRRTRNGGREGGERNREGDDNISSKQEEEEKESHKTRNRERRKRTNTTEDHHRHSHQQHHTTLDDSKFGPMTNDDVTLSIHGGDTEETNTVTTLRAQDVKDDVIKKTSSDNMGGGVEHQKLVMDAKESHLDKKQASKLHRDMRELEDIPSAAQLSEKTADK